MYIERSIYGLCAALLILFVRMDDLENDGDEGKQVMYGFSVMFGLLAVFLPFVKAVWHTFFGKLLLIPMAFTLWYFGFVAVIALYGLFHRAKPGRKFILVLGTPLNGTKPSRLLEGRLLAAEEYLRNNPQARIVLSGGQTRAEQIPESKAMLQWMVERGIPASELTAEAQSATTYQNFVLSLPLLKQLGFTEDAELAVATDLFHFLRCAWLAKKAGYRHFSLIPSKNGSLHCSSWFFREVLAFVKITLDGPG